LAPLPRINLSIPGIRPCFPFCLFYLVFYACSLSKLDSILTFELVYGLDATLLVHLKLPVSQFVQRYGLNKIFQQSRIDQLVELDESRRKALDQSIKNQEKVKKTFDKSSRQRVFQEGDTILLWDKRREKPGNHRKFDNLWTGPYIIQSIAGKKSFFLSRLDGERLTLPMNGQLLKLFFSEVI
jgi:hypothetical protein